MEEDRIIKCTKCSNTFWNNEYPGKNKNRVLITEKKIPIRKSGEEEIVYDVRAGYEYLLDPKYIRENFPRIPIFYEKDYDGYHKKRENYMNAAFDNVVIKTKNICPNCDNKRH